MNQHDLRVRCVEGLKRTNVTICNYGSQELEACLYAIGKGGECWEAIEDPARMQAHFLDSYSI